MAPRCDKNIPEIIQVEVHGSPSAAAEVGVLAQIVLSRAFISHEFGCSIFRPLLGSPTMVSGWIVQVMLNLEYSAVGACKIGEVWYF